jgi:hypothetical protein
VEQEVQAALDAQKPTIVAQCWTPPGPSEPTSVVLTYDMTFGADGSLVTLAISDQREAFRPSVSACVRSLPPPTAAVSAARTSTRVALKLRLP